MINGTQIVNTGYEVMLTGIFAALIAQIIKFLLHLIVKKKIDFKVFTTTGGMPSSHSAGVVGLSTAVGLISGFDSIIFAVSAGYATVVMYDAAGLRRASGKMATCLNKIMDDFYKHDVQSAGGKLKELLGHTPVEVFAGALLGFVYACYMHFYFLS
ncbi:MAG TPA: divergent PAP2 family protein [Candidatus Gastranaerophilaceae bacterium]|nr:divergent PAP2 family protein [Candidatus Gastranaerophilaceae bacterium]